MRSNHYSHAKYLAQKVHAEAKEQWDDEGGLSERKILPQYQEMPYISIKETSSFKIRALQDSVAVGTEKMHKKRLAVKLFSWGKTIHILSGRLL